VELVLLNVHEVIDAEWHDLPLCGFRTSIGGIMAGFAFAKGPPSVLLHFKRFNFGDFSLFKVVAQIPPVDGIG
jgi:hypothetical protein